MNAWTGNGLLLAVLSGGLLLGQEAAPPPPTQAARPEAPAPKLRAGAVVVGEIGSPVVLKGLEDIPTVMEGTAPANLRGERLLPPATVRHLRLDRSRYGGVLGEAMLAERPLDLFNPLAPLELGDGTRHLMRNPHTGRGEGLILFSFRLRDRGSAKSLAKRRAKRAPTTPAKSAPKASPKAATTPQP